MSNLLKYFTPDEIQNKNKECLKKSKNRQIEIIKNNTIIKQDIKIQKVDRSLKVISLILNNKELLNKYKITGTIYEKNNKAVLKIRSKENNKKYLLKIKSINENIHDEVEIFNKLRLKIHDNIIKFIDYKNCDHYYYFIYEYFNGINLSDYIHDNYDNFNDCLIKNIIKQILNGFNFLHKNNIIHCDIKLDNIMINKKNIIKIIDFDLSKIIKKEYISDSIFGTIQYIAPESYDLCIYSKKSDIWSLGIVFYNIITNEFPYKNISSVHSNRNMYKWNEFKHPNLKIIKEIAKKNNYSQEIVKIIISMLTFKDENRPTIEKILNNNWLKD
jgi:calcium-dependent protein kinase